MSRTTARALLLTLGFAALFPVARAQEPIPTKPLTLEEVMARVMQRNFDLQIQGFSTDIARESLNVSQAGFDPTLTASATRTLNQAAATTSSLDGTTAVGARNDNTNVNVGVNQVISETGATVALSTAVSRAGNNSRFSTLNPAFGNNITATVSQPLLKGFGPATTRATLERNKLGLNIAGYNFKTKVLQVIHDTEVAYNNLVSARETLRIRGLSLELAQRLLDENTARRSTGLMTDLDVLSAQVGVSNAQLALVQAGQQVQNSEDALLNLTGPADFKSRPGGVTFSEYTDGKPSFDVSFKQALDNSPDYFATVAAVKQFEIDLAAARQNRLPTLNLNGSLGYNNTDDSYDSAITNLPQRHGNNWTVGLTYNMPWGLKADRARFRSTLSSLNQQKARLVQFEQGITVNVRTAVRAVETSLTTVEIAAKATELSTRQYELQKARFDNGLSTSRLVLQAQDDLETARFNELNAKVTLRNAVATLHQLEGSSLQRFKIELPQ